MNTQHPPFLAGASVMAVSDGRVLLVKRGKPPLRGHWAFPGGSAEEGETAAETAQRELAEETALNALDLTFIGTSEHRQHGPNGETVSLFAISRFLCTRFEGEAMAGDDAEELGWFTPAEATALPLVPGIGAFMEEALEAARR